MDRKDKTMICSHCKHSEHNANSCFALIRYPDWWDDRPCTDGKNGGRGKGSQSLLQHGKDKIMIFFHCKCSGHDTNYCFALIRYPSGGVIDHALMKRMEVVVGDRNPRFNEQKKGQTEVVVLYESM